MKRILFCLSVAFFVLSCNNGTTKTETTSTDSTTQKPAVDLPYTASFSSSWSADVSDADLKMVLTTYKDWADGNISNLSKEMGDSVYVDFNTGDHFNGTNADLMKIWSKTRDSLSSVAIDMEGWQKMYATDKKAGFVVTWYKETDTYKMGKVDSAYYHDINEVKNGKITWYSQYKRPAKK
ncbi:MAG: hypothetical protein ACHQF0_03475 [Chitinophagales bacterium]